MEKRLFFDLVYIQYYPEKSVGDYYFLFAEIMIIVAAMYLFLRLIYVFPAFIAALHHLLLLKALPLCFVKQYNYVMLHHH